MSYRTAQNSLLHKCVIVPLKASQASLQGSVMRITCAGSSFRFCPFFQSQQCKQYHNLSLRDWGSRAFTEQGPGKRQAKNFYQMSTKGSRQTIIAAADTSKVDTFFYTSRFLHPSIQTTSCLNINFLYLNKDSFVYTGTMRHLSWPDLTWPEIPSTNSYILL